MSVRAGLPLCWFVALCGCTSADIVAHKPRQVQPDVTKTVPPAPQREYPATIGRVPLPVFPAAPPTPATTVAPPSAVPRAPVPVTACDPGGCWSAGERYQGGAGSTYLDRNGRLCQSNGIWMQCF